MKPLPPEPLTDEDRAAWFDWQVSRRRAWVRDWLLWGALENLSFAADRRDAELMSEAVQLLRCPIWSKRFASPPGGRMLDQMTMAREWVGL